MPAEQHRPERARVHRIYKALVRNELSADHFISLFKDLSHTERLQLLRELDALQQERILPDS